MRRARRNTTQNSIWLCRGVLLICLRAESQHAGPKPLFPPCRPWRSKELWLFLLRNFLSPYTYFEKRRVVFSYLSADSVPPIERSKKLPWNKHGNNHTTLGRCIK